MTILAKSRKMNIKLWMGYYKNAIPLLPFNNNNK